MDKTNVNTCLTHWLDRNDNKNQRINQNFLKNQVYSFDELNKLPQNWIYNHIPKTGGTSLESSVSQLFLMQECLHINAPDLNKLPDIIGLKKHFPRFIAGHHPMHGLLYQLLPLQKYVHLTLLRKPEKRVVSYYNYLTSRKYHALHENVANLDFNSFLKQDKLVELRNGQSRRLAGVLHNNEDIDDDVLFNQVKYIIDHCFTLVGVTELFDAFLNLIEKKCQVTFNKALPKNPSKISISLNDLSQSQVGQINAMNAVDNRLYEYVFEKFCNY